VAASQVAAHDQWVEGLGKDFRLILIDYPGEPKMYTLTPAAVSRDYLAVADAVGAARFAYYGYSWGAVTGLQLALRTNRLTALVAGGFPMIDGPYAAMLRLCHLMEQGPVKASYFEIPWMPESARQFVTYYEGLRTFDDRAAQPRLSCPRLTFAGTADLIAANGEVVANIGQTVADRKAELDQAGWEVRLLEGLDHLGAAAPGAVIPLIGEWLRRSVPA
jgi:pimeloyl-ACP methyl ester carboxylesterase